MPASGFSVPGGVNDVGRGPAQYVCTGTPELVTGTVTVQHARAAYAARRRTVNVVLTVAYHQRILGRKTERIDNILNYLFLGGTRAVKFAACDQVKICINFEV